MRSRITISLLLLLVIFSQSALACSGIFMNKDGVRLIGRTMDWKTGHTMVVVNERGISKKAGYLQDKSTPAKWTSKYGSVTFNLRVDLKWYVRLAAWIARMNVDSGSSCGINEKGLYGGSYWIHPPPAVKYPSPDGKPSIVDFQLLQYMLDTSATVDEAINNIKKVRVAGFKEADFEVDLHWLIADAYGNCAVIEFPDGKLKVHKNPAIPVITNSFYEYSRQYASQFTGFGGKKPIPVSKGEMSSENRFVFAASALDRYERMNKLTVTDVFAIMKNVTQTTMRHASTSQALTQWTTVYDLKAKKLWWTNRVTPGIRSIEIGKIDFSPSKKVRKIDSFTPLTGDITGKF